jgi:prepilin-type N-terminal cleavage/methylation domain-containing protein
VLSNIKSKERGFTIVELLIVIVVIAILAAISIVAYNGIQNRANDSAVQSDLANFAKKIQVYRVYNDEYPATAAQLDDSNVDWRASTGAYATDTQNAYYCTQPATSINDAYVILGKSKSGTIFYVSSTGSGTVAGSTVSVTNTCNVIGITYAAGPPANAFATPGFTFATQTWNAWTQ